MFSRKTNQRRRSLRLALAGALGILLAITGCGAGGAGSTSSGSSGGLIGVSVYTNQQPGLNYAVKTIEKVAKENGDRVVSQFANGNSGQQVNQVQSMLQQGVKVLVLVMVDPKAFVPVVKQAQAQGVKVIAYDDNVVGAKVDYYLVRDNVELGRLQAQSVVDHLPKDRVAKVAIIRGDPATPSVPELMEAYTELLINNPKVKVVYDQTTPGWDQAAAQRNAEAALQRDPDIDAFAVMWDNGTQGVVQALKAAGKQPGQVWSTGTNASPVSLTYISQGWQGQSTYSDYTVQATNAANVAHAFITNQDPPKPDKTTDDGVPVLTTPQVSVTKDNLCEFLTKQAPPGWMDGSSFDMAATCG